MKVYVCDLWDDYCDFGEHYTDNRCYLHREDAEKRAKRMTHDDDDCIGHYAMVMELDACWKQDDSK